MKKAHETYIANKVILITGASSGIGEAAACTLARFGAHLVLAARRSERLQALADQITSAGGQVLIKPTDITDILQIHTLVEDTISQFGRIDVLINNAGRGLPAWFEEFTPQDLRDHFEVNVLGLAELTRQVIPYMKAQRSGQILNLISYTSQLAIPRMTAYSGASYAIEGLSDGLRRELAPWGISVTRIHIGKVGATEFYQTSKEKNIPHLPAFPRGRLTAEQVADELVKIIERPQPIVYLEPENKFFATLNRRAPSWVDAAAIRWVQRKRRAELRKPPEILVEPVGGQDRRAFTSLAPLIIGASAALAGIFFVRSLAFGKLPFTRPNDNRHPGS